VILGHRDERVTRAVIDAAKRGGAFGLSTEHEVRLATIVTERVPSVERVRFVTSGTEASMTAARIARAATGRTTIVKFEGNYHGHSDAFLAKAGSGVATFGIPMAAGVPEASVADTIVVPYNDVGALERAFEREIAAVFVEPVAANMGVVVPDRAFIDAVVSLANAHGAVTVFDEVVTGFRLGSGAVQTALGLMADLTMFGKVLGGGLPVGAVGGRAELMDLLAPVGPVYQAGTYAAHPHAMAAGVAALEALRPDDYVALEATAAALADGLSGPAKDAGACVVRAGTFLCVFFSPDEPRNFDDAQATDRKAFARFHAAMRERGVLLAPSPFECWFPSLAHGDAEIDATIAAAREAFTS
jgi:glutamate-1-semialdehyde 2,1-aminomutase